MAAHRVLIVCGGFGGLAAAKALRGGPVEVALVDWQAQLAQVAIQSGLQLAFLGGGELDD